jgi:hypothetical protein
MAYCLLSMEIPSARRIGTTRANACEIEAGKLAGLAGCGGDLSRSTASSSGGTEGFEYNYLESLGYKYSIIYLMRIVDIRTRQGPQQLGIRSKARWR